MQTITEKRNSMRLEVECEVYLRSLRSDELYKASCVTLNGSGIGLVCDQNFQEKEELEVKILPDCTLMKPMSFQIRIVYKNLQSDGFVKYGAMILLDNNRE